MHMRQSFTRLPGRCRPALAAMLLVVLAAACGGSSGSGTDGAFRVGTLNTFLLHLTPGQGANSFIDHALFTPLTSIDPESQEVRMEVAESIESDDQRHWTITLKPDWTFSDGSPVTAKSFADSWNATALGANGWIGNIQFSIIAGYADLNPTQGEAKTKKLSGLNVVDERTLEVTLTEPMSMFPRVLSGTPWAPMPESAFDDLEAYDKLPVGNGPFMIEGDGIGPGVQELTLVRNDDYAGTKARAESVEIKVYQEPKSAYTSFQGGAIDMVLVDGANYADAMSRYPDQIESVSFPALVYLGFPLWDERFDDPAARKAIALAIDRESIAGSLLRDAVDPATTLAPPSVLGSEGVECGSCSYEPEAARQLFGSWNGALTLWTNDDPTQSEVLKAIANELRSTLGISEVATRTQPVDQIFTNLAEKKIDGPFLLYTGVPYPHLYTLTKNLFTPGPYNVTGYSSSEVTAHLEAAAAASSSEETVTESQKAAVTALDDVALTPVYFPRGGIVYGDKIESVTPEILGGPHLAGVEVR